jgi:hypothetical protein
MAQIVEAVAPVAWEAFQDYQLRAEHFSSLEIEALARLLDVPRDAWPTDEEIMATLPRSWLDRNSDGSLKRNRERDEFLSKVKRMKSARRSA